MLRDADIRDSLCDYLEERYGKVRFFDELVMGKSRADLVLVTERGLLGVEIKSDADTYQRLAGQVRDYDRYFDFNVAAVGSTHAMQIGEHVPEHWGIVTVEEVLSGGRRFADFYELRAPRPSPKVKLANQLDLLWRRELARIQAMNGLHKYAGKRRSFVKKYIMENVPEELLKQQVTDILYERDYSVLS